MLDFMPAILYNTATKTKRRFPHVALLQINGSQRLRVFLFRAFGQACDAAVSVIGTMKHGDAKVEAKQGLDALDVDG